MIMDVLVLQHIACEPPGEYETVLRERGANLHRVELDEGDRLPPWRDFDAIVAMGGPMSVNDDAELPWLTDEKRAIGEAVRAGVPYFGACLGVQLLAAGLGARVYAGPEPEVGVLPVTLTAEGAADPLFAALPPEFPALQWHGDTFDLPEGATRLASSPAFPNQAFRYGESAYGIQFHVEVLPEMAREWAQVPAYADYADRVLGEGGMARLLDEFDAAQAAMRATGRDMFARWADLAVPAAR
jgi:GMP synthase-like glutamine amidotransferase